MESRGRWAIGSGLALAGIVVGVLTLGPDEVLARISWPWAGYPQPSIVSVEADPEGRVGTYIATLKNPSWKPVAITGYQTSSTVDIAAYTGADGDGGVTVMDAKEPDPGDCTKNREVRFARPLKIEAGDIRGLRIRPHRVTCPFEIAFDSDNGSTKSRTVWSIDPAKLEEELKPRSRAVQTCVDGTVVLATDKCPPAARGTAQ